MRGERPGGASARSGLQWGMALPTPATPEAAGPAVVVATDASVADVERLPDDGYRYDLIAGQLIRMSPAGALHGEIASRIGRHLGNVADVARLGVVFGAETGFVLREPDVMLAPDAAFVRAERLPPRADWRGYLRLAPDLAVEVVSPSDRWRDVMDKVDQYLQAGVQRVWVLDPQRQAAFDYERGGRTVRILRVADGDALDGADVLPGFRLLLADLFPADAATSPPPSAPTPGSPA